MAFEWRFGCCFEHSGGVTRFGCWRREIWEFVWELLVLVAGLSGVGIHHCYGVIRYYNSDAERMTLHKYQLFAICSLLSKMCAVFSYLSSGANTAIPAE